MVGSAVAIHYDLIKIHKLRFPESITEDYALTLYAARIRKLKVTVMPFILSIGNAPKNFRAYVKQQLRWAEGTIRDAKIYFWSVILNNTISLEGKVDFLFHLNLYLQGLWMIITIIAWISGVAYGYLIIPVLIFQLMAYFKTITNSAQELLDLVFLLKLLYGCCPGLRAPQGHSYKAGLILCN